MDQIISYFVGLRGSIGALRHSLAVLWIITGLVTLAAPGATQETSQRAAELTVCKVDRPDDTMNVKYRASVRWLNSTTLTSRIVTFHIGALNLNDELWPQVTSGRIARGGDARVDFVVSRRSTFPTRFAVFGLDQSAEDARANACRLGSCYLQLPREGVFPLSNEFLVNEFDQSVNRCPNR